MDFDELLVAYIRESDKAMMELNKTSDNEISAYDIQKALADELSLDDEFELLGKELTSEQIFNILSNYDFKKYKPIKLLEVHVEDTILPDVIELRLVEAQFKHLGEIWVVHKNDADPFPSNPHAHCYEKGLKLHLGNGKLYLGAKHVSKVSKKKFIALRSKMSNINLPELSI